MSLKSRNLPGQNPRLAFHYYPDFDHYRENDLNAWLPELRALGAGRLVLQAPTDRAIPEAFITGLVAGGIEPVLHFQAALSAPPASGEVAVLLEPYARWGVRDVIFFDRPNSRPAWGAKAWAQEDLVERFLDRYLPLADAALNAGLRPIFPPLDPGGNYWDTAFLRAALESLQRRKAERHLASLALAAYAWSFDRPLDWGAGGPERWAGARPYFTPEGEQDQRGLRIFDWYGSIARQALGASVPIILLGAGSAAGPLPGGTVDPFEHAETCLSIARLLAGEEVPNPEHPELPLAPIPDEVTCAAFWLLAAETASPYRGQAWFPANAAALPAAGALRQWHAAQAESKGPEVAQPEPADKANGQHVITHYLLLPYYEWGVSDWHLEIIQPFIKKHRPTVGFSLEEAACAAKVTVVGGEQSFSDDALAGLTAHGCQVERISGDGITIATILAER